MQHVSYIFFPNKRRQSGRFPSRARRASTRLFFSASCSKMVESILGGPESEILQKCYEQSWISDPPHEEIEALLVGPSKRPVGPSVLTPNKRAADLTHKYHIYIYMYHTISYVLCICLPMCRHIDTRIFDIPWMPYIDSSHGPSRVRTKCSRKSACLGECKGTWCPSKLPESTRCSFFLCF